MKETEERIKEWEAEEEQLWKELDKPKEDGKFLKLKDGEPYQIQVNAFHLENKPFNEGEKPKLRVVVDLKAVNGDPVKDKIFECGSFTVMKELKKYRGDSELPNHIFFMMREKIGGNYRYTFKKMGTLANSAREGQGAGAQAPSPQFFKPSKEDKVEAFLDV